MASVKHELSVDEIQKIQMQSSVWKHIQSAEFFFLSLFGLVLIVYNSLYVCLYLPHAPSVHLAHFLALIPANWAKFSFLSANDRISHSPLSAIILALEMSIYLKPFNMQDFKFNCPSPNEGES